MLKSETLLQVPKLCAVVREDEEASVVCTVLEELVHLLKECGQAVTCVQGHPEQVIQCVHLVMRSECKCMDAGADDGFAGGPGGEDEHEAEQVGGCPALGKSLCVPNQ